MENNTTKLEAFKVAMGVISESDGQGLVITDWEMLVNFWADTFWLAQDHLAVLEVKNWTI